MSQSNIHCSRRHPFVFDGQIGYLLVLLVVFQVVFEVLYEIEGLRCFGCTNFTVLDIVSNWHSAIIHFIHATQDDDKNEERVNLVLHVEHFSGNLNFVN